MNTDIKQALSNVREYVLDIIFPSFCCCCSERVCAGEFLCDECAKELERFRTKRSRVVSYKSVKYRLYSVYDYKKENAASAIVSNLKFNRRLSCSRFMGKCIAEKAKNMGMSFDIITYVPITRYKEIKRGFNQTEYISKHTAKALGVRHKCCLIKQFNTADQHHLTARQRRLNLHNAFRVDGDVNGKHILLIDDVITTGTTMSECAHVLYNAGAKSVTLLSFAMGRISH